MLTTRSNVSNDDLTMDLATLMTRFLQSESVQHNMSNHLIQLEYHTTMANKQLQANTQATSTNTHAISVMDQKLDAMSQANSQQFKEISTNMGEMAQLMTAIHARIGGSTSDTPKSNNSGNPIMQQVITDTGNSRRDELPNQGVILEQEQTRRGEMR